MHDCLKTHRVVLIHLFKKFNEQIYILIFGCRNLQRITMSLKHHYHHFAGHHVIGYYNFKCMRSFE